VALESHLHESAHLAFSQLISFHPDTFRLVFRSPDHPLLSIYVLELSKILFGDSNFCLRILHVLLGTATVYWAYLLG
jgi:4-amino-4-deoxy-L-arabinose transferase-like glycosyltransferase